MLRRALAVARYRAISGLPLGDIYSGTGSGKGLAEVGFSK